MARHRAIVNTVISITASTLSSTFVTRATMRKYDMEVMQNAALAGGVIMGAACDIIVHPGFCMLAGMLAGIISAVGFLFLNPLVGEKLNLQDTCGVTWLHGIPGLLGSIAAVAACGAARHNFENDMQTTALLPQWPGRSSEAYVGYEFVGIGLSLAFSIPPGLLVGWLTSVLLPYPA